MSLGEVLLGYLILRSGCFPRVFGVFFLIASVSYVADSIHLLFVAGDDTPPVYFAPPITVLDIAFSVWLLAWGVNLEE